MICYMAGPIDLVPKGSLNWKEQIIDLCRGENINFYDPVGPFKIFDMTPNLAKYIHDVNMCALSNADVVVGYLMKATPSVGTPIEFYSCAGTKPMFIITDLDESVYMEYIRSRGQVVFCQTVEDMRHAMIDYLEVIEKAGKNG